MDKSQSEFTTVANVLTEVYGTAPYALVQQVIDEYHVPDYPDDVLRSVSNVIWIWYAGGTTAYAAGERIIKLLGGE